MNSKKVRSLSGNNPDPLWFKDAVIYELHIKSYYDSNRDGIGDLPGLTSRLDYLVDLGVTTVWLLPFYPSPLRDDGYDISDYLSINPDYGSLKDFRHFLKQAHSKGIRVITELVLNHTSDQHPWFKRSRKAPPGSSHRDFYVWSDRPERYQDARIIFKDFESSNWTWDAETGLYYWHRFYSHQPDLNFENPEVQQELLKTVDFWLATGVDGLRLDAVPYLFEQEGTNCENLPRTHDFLKKLRSHVDHYFPGRMLLAEANQWPEDAVAYFGQGDECHMAFHFPIMPRIFMSLQMEDRFPLVDILEQTPPIPETAQWAIFLRNHDELTLEMVTDEERDYMYRSYAADPRSRINLGIRRRLAPLLGNDRRQIELACILLFTLPGTPVLYYGDEIGMGDNYYLGDRDGVRTPMQWSPDRNAGFSGANPQRLLLPVIIDPEYHYETVNVENQQRNPSSLYWWMKSVIALRKKCPALGRGDMRFLYTENSKVLAFARTEGEQTVIAVINLSRLSQVAYVDFSAYTGRVPRELFSQNLFPVITSQEYPFTLGPHSYFLFQLEPEQRHQESPSSSDVPVLNISWQDFCISLGRDLLENKLLPVYLPGCAWFQAAGRPINSIKIKEILPIGPDKAGEYPYYHLLLDAFYVNGQKETYQLALSFIAGDTPLPWLDSSPQAIISPLHLQGTIGILLDAFYDPRYRSLLLQAFQTSRRMRSRQGQLRFTLQVKSLPAPLPAHSQVLKQDRHNAAISYGENYFLKLYRRMDNVINPEVEILHHLTHIAKTVHTPGLIGALYFDFEDGRYTLGALEKFLPHEQDGWSYTLDTAGRFLDRLLSRRGEFPHMPQYPADLMSMSLDSIPGTLAELGDPFFFEFCAILGSRTAELHQALAVIPGPDFEPENFSLLYQRSLYQSMQGKVRQLSISLEQYLTGFPHELQPVLQSIVSRRSQILDILKKVTEDKIQGAKIRIHNEYHLGQVLFTGRDVSIIDFEGHPDTAISERRLKRSVARDLVGMVRSMHYAGYHALLNHPHVDPTDLQHLLPWIEYWYSYAAGSFLTAYLAAPVSARLLPEDPGSVKNFFEAFLMESLLDELEYHLRVDQRMIIVSIQGINRILDS